VPEPTVFSGLPLLLVEGVHDKGFFEALGANRGLPPFQVYVYEGKQRFKERFSAVVAAETFALVRSLGVTQDADTSPAGVWDSVRAHLAAKGLAVPVEQLAPVVGPSGRRVTVLVMPSPGQPGDLETLAYSSVDGTPPAHCVGALYACLDATAIPHDDSGKSRLHVFLATRPTFIGSIQKSFGLGLVPLDSEVFNEAAAFLEAVTAA
jgi:hypothetical protein